MSSWAKDDVLNIYKLRQKTRLVCSGDYLSNVTDLYSGQLAYINKKNSSYLLDKAYYRMAANAAWSPTNLTESAELSLDNTPDQGISQTANLERRYAFFTMPTSHRFYIITAIQWKNITASSSVQCGVDLVDAIPPVNNNSSLVAIGQTVAQVGNSSLQRNNNIASRIIRGGALVGCWIMLSDGLGILSSNGGTNPPIKAIGSFLDPKFASSTPFTTGLGNIITLWMYFRGYS